MKSLFIKVIAPIIFFTFIALALTFAQEESAFKIQGLIMNLDLQSNIMIVNERMFTWNKNTKFYNDNGFPMTVDKLKAKNWVYIEGVRDSVKKRVMAEKIYMLPKYISGKEKYNYPFMQ